MNQPLMQKSNLFSLFLLALTKLVIVCGNNIIQSADNLFWIWDMKSQLNYRQALCLNMKAHAE